ncbi:hypothetical protein C3942_07500 [Solimonas fluminis]|uniref:Uncharacterized protein n=1 Tax=Solimonas fluminis TaxID=2086571 RepID=A0A2S5THZ4_9GAMM|nr:hypothetical protein [Solimonas fluminis]PPE74599.1 hypothetical protein C3942_07500 [Solimonas fluminis]
MKSYEKNSKAEASTKRPIKPSGAELYRDSSGKLVDEAFRKYDKEYLSFIANLDPAKRKIW